MKYPACLLALAILGTCHDRHLDVSAQVRSGHALRVKDASDHLVRTIADRETIDRVAAFMAAHSDSWSGEEIFGTLPALFVLLDVVNEKQELLVGLGIGDESLWMYPSKGVWRRLDRRERDRLLQLIGIEPASVEGLQRVSERPQNNKMQQSRRG